MRKLLITENDKKEILSKHYGDSNSKLFQYLVSNFMVSSDIQYHDITDGRGELIVFQGKIKDMFGDEIEEVFRYNRNKKELKDKIVNFIKDDPEIYDILQVRGISTLIKLLRDAETKEDIKLYSTELKNQMDINYDRIDAQLNKTVKSFIDFYTK
jgi:hypothetical protein